MLSVRLFATLWTVARQALLSMRFSRQHWNGLPCPPAGDLPRSGIKFISPALAGGFFTTEPAGKPPITTLLMSYTPNQKKKSLELKKNNVKKKRKKKKKTRSKNSKKYIYEVC